MADERAQQGRVIRFASIKNSLTFVECSVSLLAMDKRKQILDAALRLFVTLGFHGTPTSKIAQEAGVANGTLFHYFPTKDHLVLALYADVKSRLNEYVGENALPVPDFRETVKAAYLASLYWALEHKDEFSYIQQFNSSPYTALLGPEEAEQQTKMITDMLRTGIKDKIIKPLPVDLLYSLVSGHTYALNQYLVKGGFPQAKQHQYINDSFELLWDMLT